MGLFSAIFGGGGILPETKEAMREGMRRDPYMKQVARDARRSVLGKGRDDLRAGADRRDHGFWSW